MPAHARSDHSTGWLLKAAAIATLLFSAVEVLSFQLQILSDRVPYQFLLMLPFVSVLVVMVAFRKRIEFPASLGRPYGRE